VSGEVKSFIFAITQTQKQKLCVKSQRTCFVKIFKNINKLRHELEIVSSAEIKNHKIIISFIQQFSL